MRGIFGQWYCICLILQEQGGLNWYDHGSRMYDAAIGRWSATDPATQFASPYLAMGNNPVMYTDPNGEFIFTALALIIPGAQGLLPWAIGADIGMWSGGAIANGTANPFKWDYSSGRTWGYMGAGALTGGLSGGAASAVATSGIPFANTAAIMTGSFVNSVGTHMYTGGQTDISVSFGFGAFNFSNGTFGYLGKKGNSLMENIGYGFGLIANLNDVLAGLKPGSIELRTENDPNYHKSVDTNGDPVLKKDIIGHSQLNNDGKVLIDWGPAERLDSQFGTVSATNSYESGLIHKMKDGKFWRPVNIKGVNVGRITKFSNFLNKGGKYNMLYNSCVSQTSRALTMSGMINIGIHPYILQAQAFLRNVGVRPSLFGYYLN